MVSYHMSRSALFVIALVLFFSLVPSKSNADENEWKLMGKTANKKLLLYVDMKSVTYISEDIVRFKVRKEYSEEGLQERKESYKEQIKKAEEESGTKIDEPDKLFEMIIKSEKIEQLYDIDCKNNEVKRHPPTRSAINIVVVDPIAPGSTEDHIKNELCRKK